MKICTILSWLMSSDDDDDDDDGDDDDDDDDDGVFQWLEQRICETWNVTSTPLVNVGCQQIVWVWANKNAICEAVTWEPDGNLCDVSGELGLSQSRVLEVLPWWSQNICFVTFLLIFLTRIYTWRASAWISFHSVQLMPWNRTLLGKLTVPVF